MTIAGLYGLAGLVFGLVFVTLGLSRVDPPSRGSPWSFRLIILPGVIALWPLLVTRWARSAPYRPGGGA